MSHLSCRIFPGSFHFLKSLHMLSSFLRVTFNFSASSRGLDGWGSDQFISLPLLDNHELVIFGMEYPSIAVRWSPSSSIISTSCCEDPLLEFSSWDTSRLSCQHWRDIFSAFENDCLQSTIFSLNRIEKTELYKVLFFVFYLFELGSVFFLNCVCSPLTCKRVCLRLTWAEWRKKINN